MGAQDKYAFSDKAETDHVRSLAETLGLRFPDLAESGSDKNLIGIKSDTLLFSHRFDSRTYFVHDREHGTLDAAGVYHGSEREQIEFGKNIFRMLDIPLDEIDRTDVLKEQLGGAEFDHQGNIVRIAPVREGAHHVWFTRQMEGLPVWDSRLLLSLTQAKTIGFMELHWPKIPSLVVREAHRMAEMIAANWQPPAFENAYPEKLEAGIIHSAALGFFMDVYPTIRVTYRLEKGAQAVIPRFHFDRYGNRLPFPRQVDLTTQQAQETPPRQARPAY